MYGIYAYTHERNLHLEHVLKSTLCRELNRHALCWVPYNDSQSFPQKYVTRSEHFLMFAFFSFCYFPIIFTHLPSFDFFAFPYSSIVFLLFYK